MGHMADAPFIAVDLSRLPPPDVVELLDFDTIFASAVARMQQQMADFEARESDPATKQLLVLSYFVQLLRQRINDAARAVMPAYATGADLDNLAAIFGVTRFPGENDTDFRRRMVLAPEGYSVAGPEGAYIFHALSADAAVLDASAISPAPGEVLVSVLSRIGSGAAPDALLSVVRARLNERTIRPLTDALTVQSATIVNYVVTAHVTTFIGPDSAIVLASARTRLDAYVADCHRLGRDVTRSGIFAALHVAGVQNVNLVAPAADLIIDRTQAPFCTAITLVDAGIGE